MELLKCNEAMMNVRCALDHSQESEARLQDVLLSASIELKDNQLKVSTVKRAEPHNDKGDRPLKRARAHTGDDGALEADDDILSCSYIDKTAIQKCCVYSNNV